MPCCLRRFFFALIHVFSISCVWRAGWSGSTKCLSCTTTLWVYMPLPIWSMLAYAAHPSDMIWLPGSIQRLMIGSSVAAARSGTSTKIHRLDLLSIAPNTQRPSLHRPRWYFLWKNLLSSISTSIGSLFSSKPPNSWGLFSITFSQTSLKKVHHRLTEFPDKRVSLCICNCKKSAAQE